MSTPVFTSKKLQWISVGALTFLLAIFYLYESPTFHIHASKVFHKELFKVENPHDGKIILFWTKFFESRDFYVGFGKKPFYNCHVSGCQTTNDRSLLNISHAVIFHIRDLSLSDLPAYRFPHQRWIFFLMESPQHTPAFLKSLTNFFNWTMTYRSDSDIYTPYSVTVSKADKRNQDETTESLRNAVHRKKKKVAWFVSNCHTNSGREKYADQLQKYIEVDVFGTCGTMECSHRLQCYKMIEHDYKFYLAFENSLCRDYVTEKFYNALLYKTVPIVYGGADYAKIAPNHSYIDVRDYVSVKKLAEHLKFLDRDEEAYMKYLHWRSTGLSSLSSGSRPWCSLCDLLHNDSLPERSYEDIHSWWFEQGQCGKDKATFDQLLT